MSVRTDEFGSQRSYLWPGFHSLSRGMWVWAEVGVWEVHRQGLIEGTAALHPYKDKPGQISYGSQHLNATFQLWQQKKEKKS